MSKQPLIWRQPRWLPRSLAALLVIIGLPLVLSVSAFIQEAPIRVDEPSPRTVIAPDLIRVADPERTEQAQREAAQSVEPVMVEDEEARAAIPQAVRDAFNAAQDAREPATDDDDVPSRAEQIAGLEDRLPMLDDDGLRVLVRLSDEELARTADQAEAVAVDFADRRITDDELEIFREERLASALRLRSWEDGVATEVVEPIIADALQPTVQVDSEATAEVREEAADAVEEVAATFTRGQTIVVAGQEVTELQAAALRQSGQQGAEPWLLLAQSFLLMAVLFVAVTMYLRTYRPELWRSTRRMVLLALLALLYIIALEAVTVLAPAAQPAWMFLVPVGALAMLVTILFDPSVAVLMTIPATAAVGFTAEGNVALVAFVAVASLASVPLVSRLSRKGDLRKAAVQSIIGYAVLAAAATAIFDGVDINVLWAAGAGAVNGVLTAVIVNGSLPFLESAFGILTATSLLDLADRNHPMMRELEQKAPGTYNHSIMVSTLVERACRRIEADDLLGSVCALYHDIGKVRRPYFFVENQFAIDNPHDSLEPETSARIIQEHVTDGIKMAESFRLPPEVADGIGSHHGTTLVKYFYRQAQLAAADPASVDEGPFRYKGRKPASKEHAVLMLADTCEGAVRAAAQNNRNFSRQELEDIVRGLIDERVEDGQLDEASLTFAELSLVQDSLVETLVGVYHPRIAYPDEPTAAAEPSMPDRDSAVPAPSPDAPAPVVADQPPAERDSGGRTNLRRLLQTRKGTPKNGDEPTPPKAGSSKSRAGKGRKDT